VTFKAKITMLVTDLEDSRKDVTFMVRVVEPNELEFAGLMTDCVYEISIRSEDVKPVDMSAF
jgi:hypothetical protein